jgi:hypothetical protein
MSKKTKNQRRHFLIVQAHMSHGYQIFDALSGSYDEGYLSFFAVHPKTLRRPEDGDSYMESVHLRVHGQQGSGLRGIEDAKIYGNRIEIQCAHDGYNSEWQTKSLTLAWRNVEAKLKKFENLGEPVGYVEVCIRLAAALDYGLAYRQNGENRIVSPDGFRHWVQTMAERAVNVEI